MNVLELKKLKVGCPVMVAHIPIQIQNEIKLWVYECSKIKEHPLSYLKAHENVGYLGWDGEKHNSYQCSIPPRLIEESYWLAWILRLCQQYYGTGEERQFRIRKHDGHFDGYDVWTNFAYKGDNNPQHNHTGFLSGVIYYQNHYHPTIFDEYNCEYEGKDGTMTLFPSEVLHHVEALAIDKERITIAFNIINTN